MRRWLIGFVVCVLWATQAQAQTNIVTFETVTFGASSTGLTATTIRPSGQGFVTICSGKIETAQIRYRYDGVAPTASIGVLGDIGDVITINGLANIDLFRGIKTGSSSGVINFSCARDGIVNTTGSGSGSSGGGAGTSNTTETTQLAVLAAVDGLEGFTDGLEASSTLIASAVFAEDVTAVGGDKGIQTLCVRRATAPADMSSGATAGDYEPCQVDANGRVYQNSSIYTPAGDSAMDDTLNTVVVSNATAANFLVTTTSDDQQAEDNSIPYALTLPTVISLNYCDNTSVFVRCPIGTGGAGTVDASTSRVVLATDDLLTATTKVDDAAFTPATSRVMVIGYEADESSTDSVDEGDTGAPRMTLDRLAFAVPAATTASSQALLECAIISAASTNATNCKNAAGNFYGVDLVNTTTAVYYLRLYNTSSAPTCSSATGFIRSIPVPPAAAAGGAGGIVRVLPIGVNYGTGISYCLTASSASTANDNAATGIFGTVLYK